MGTASRLLKQLIRELIQNGDVSPLSIATKVYAAQPEIVKQWTLQNLVRASKRLVAELPPPPSPFQAYLPGYRSFDERLKLPEGSVLLAEASVRQLRENLKVLNRQLKAVNDKRRDRLKGQIAERQKLIKDMSRYRRPHEKLDVRQYCELKAAGAEPPRAKRPASSRKAAAKKGKATK